MPPKFTFSRRVATLLDEGPIHQQIVDDAEHRQSGRSQREADRSGTLDDFSLLHHLLGDRVSDVVDAAGLDPGVDLGLGLAVGRIRAVPFQVIRLHVEDGS